MQMLLYSAKVNRRLIIMQDKLPKIYLYVHLFPSEIPDRVGGLPVRQRLGYGLSEPARIGLERSASLSGLPKSL